MKNYIISDKQISWFEAESWVKENNGYLLSRDQLKATIPDLGPIPSTWTADHRCDDTAWYFNSKENDFHFHSKYGKAYVVCMKN